MRSNSRTVRITLTALPYPVSQSAITGTVLESTMARVELSISLMEYSSASGMPMDAETWKPEMPMMSNPASHTSLAVSPSYALAPMAVWPLAIICRSFVVIFMHVSLV